MTPWSDERTFFLVEEGNAHRGDFDLAREMVRLAAGTGANAIEFQLAVADDFYVSTDPMHSVWRSFEFDPGQLTELATLAHESGIAIVAAPLSDGLPEVLAEIGYDALTVNSADLTNPRMLDAVAATGLPVLVATAMADLEEIDWAVERLTDAGGPLCLLHGQHIMHTSEGGVPVGDTSLRTIAFLRDRYGVPAGFIDHTSSVEVCALAAAGGAAVVTKHLAPRREWDGPEWQICLDPDEMAECVRRVRLADQASGSSEKRLAAGELADRSAGRKSVVAARDLPAGTVLAAADLVVKRPGTGLDPRRVDAFVGQTLGRNLERDEQLLEEDLDESRP